MSTLRNPRHERFAQLLASGKSANDVYATADPTEVEELTPAALRMRLYRDRRRKKLRCLTIELRATEIEALVHRGLLSREMRNDLTAIRAAFYGFLDKTLN